MNCAGVRETLPAFALGVAPPPDVSSIELHVETCAACRKEAIDLQRAVTAFGYALAPVEPAVPELEDRVVAAVQTATGPRTRRRANRHKRAGVTLLGGGDPDRSDRHRRRLRQPSGTTCSSSRNALPSSRTSFFTDSARPSTSAQYADPSADVLTGMLTAAERAPRHRVRARDRVPFRRR